MTKASATLLDENPISRKRVYPFTNSRTWIAEREAIYKSRIRCRMHPSHACKRGVYLCYAWLNYVIAQCMIWTLDSNGGMCLFNATVPKDLNQYERRLINLVERWKKYLNRSVPVICNCQRNSFRTKPGGNVFTNDWIATTTLG